MPFRAACDRCLQSIERQTREEVIAVGWQPKRADNVSLYGWTCPACVGQPIIVPRRPKRSR